MKAQLTITEIRRNCAGYYAVYTSDESTGFAIVRREDGEWYFHNIDAAQREGGDDLFPTLKAARAALSSYLETRYLHPQFGWCCRG